MAGISDSPKHIHRGGYSENTSYSTWENNPSTKEATNNETKPNKKPATDIKITMAGVQEYLASNGIDVKDNDLTNVQSIFTASNTDKTNDFDDNGNAVEILSGDEVTNFLKKLKDSSSLFKPISDFVINSYERLDLIGQYKNIIKSRDIKQNLAQEYTKLEDIKTKREELKNQFHNGEISDDEYSDKRRELRNSEREIERNIEILQYDLEDVDPETYQKLYGNSDEEQ